MRPLKLHEDNIGKTFSNINYGNIFLDQSPKAKEIKAKINKWDLIKLKSFCTAKEPINKMKRQPATEKKKIICKQCNKGLISKIYEQFIQLNNCPPPHIGMCACSVMSSSLQPHGL